ncbi:MAG: Fic family protein [Elusimicrobiota bacterium]
MRIESLKEKILDLPINPTVLRKLHESNKLISTHWVSESKISGVPCPIRAAIAHYQFAIIHPYYDGNGRTARLLTNLILNLDKYDAKGLYCLEEYYAKDLQSYNDALSIGPSHNYYLGRAESEITSWVEYFCAGMAYALGRIETRAMEAQEVGLKDKSILMRSLDKRQRKVLILFQSSEYITSNDVSKILHLKPRTSRQLCVNWVTQRFIDIKDPAKKTRKYILSKKYQDLID